MNYPHLPQPTPIIRKTKKPFWKNENGKSGREEGKTKTESSPTRTQKKRQRLNADKTVFKRCFFIGKNAQKVIVNSGKIRIFT